MLFTLTVLLAGNLLLPTCFSGTPVITDVNRLVNATDSTATAFDITAQTHFSYAQGMWLHLFTNKTYFSVNMSPEGDYNFHSGDIVRALGRIQHQSNIGPILEVTNVTVVTTASLPPPIELGHGQLLDEDLNMKAVCIHGVISSVTRDDIDAKWNWISLKTASGHIYGSIQDRLYPIDKLNKLIDAEVSMTGIVCAPGSWRNVLGYTIMMMEDGLSVTKSAPADPFSAPHYTGQDSCHRQQVSGIVVAATSSQIFIVGRNRQSIPVKLANGSDIPTIGSTITASGFVESGVKGPQLLEARIKTTDETNFRHTPTDPIVLPRLFDEESKRFLIRYGLYGPLIRTSGIVARVILTDKKPTLIHLEQDAHIINVDVSGWGNKVDTKIVPGCQIEITGICAADLTCDITAALFPVFKGFSLIPRDPSDIRILELPSWWTRQRLLFAIAILIGAIALFIIWNRALLIQSERRGRELAHEKITHAAAEIKVEERTRLAVELHDALSQTITGVALQVDTALAANNGHSKDIDGILGTARQMLASCRKDLQCCLWDLRCRTFEEKDLTEAVRKTLEPHVSRIKTQIRFNVPRSILSETATHTILKIVRELVVNAIRHGKATEIKIAGEFHDGIITFSVRDNGIGFEKEQALGPRQGHFGLHGIRERLRAHNGILTIESAPGKGSRFLVTLAGTQQ